MTALAGPGYYAGVDDHLTRTDLRDELKAFAEVVLKQHLADLANSVQRDVRKDMQQLLKEHRSTSPRPRQSPGGAAPLRAAAVAAPEQRRAAWEEAAEEPHEKLLADTVVSKGPHQSPLGMSIGSAGSEAPDERQNHRSGFLREAVLGTDRDRSLKKEVLVLELPDSDEGKSWSLHAAVRAVVQNVWFDRVASLMIFLNCVFIGVVTDYMARTGQQDAPTVCQVLEIVFLVVFALELLARLFAFRRDFFSPVEKPDRRPNPHFYWNILDCLVILFQVVEVVTLQISQSVAALERVSAFRIIRLVRLFRIVRLIKVLRFVGDLRMIVYGIWRSMSLFFWAIIALLVLNFICSVYFTELVLTKKLEGVATHPDMDKHFGSLGNSMISLFMALNGGRNWGDLTDCLSTKTPDLWVMVPFLLYMAFTLYAALNVITGLFLETAMDGARDEKELYVVCNARMVFQAADTDGKGMITWPDLERTLTHKDVRSFFNAVDIEISEAKALFKLLDHSGDGYISWDEFIEGCLRVRGPSKSLDLLVLQREVSNLFEKNLRMRKQALLRHRHAAVVHKVSKLSTPRSSPTPRALSTPRSQLRSGSSVGQAREDPVQLQKQVAPAPVRVAVAP